MPPGTTPPVTVVAPAVPPAKTGLIPTNATSEVATETTTDQKAHVRNGVRPERKLLLLRHAPSTDKGTGLPQRPLIGFIVEQSLPGLNTRFAGFSFTCSLLGVNEQNGKNGVTFLGTEPP